MPKDAMTIDDFSFYNHKMWDYDFQTEFSCWLHQQKTAQRTCCLVGIRTQEKLQPLASYLSTGQRKV